MRPTLLGLALILLAVPSGAAEPPRSAQAPYSCRLLYDEERKCGFGSCDARVVERLRKECLRDGGRP